MNEILGSDVVAYVGLKMDDGPEICRNESGCGDLRALLLCFLGY